MPASVEPNPSGLHTMLGTAVQRADDIAESSTWTGGRMSPRVRCVLADNPSPMTYTGTNTWILCEPGSTSCAVIDPGPLSYDHFDNIQAAAAEDNLDIEIVLLTHHHDDHAEDADALAELLEVPLLGPRTGLEPGPFSIGLDGPYLEVVPLPGHCKDMYGFVFPADHSVLSADLLFEQSSTVIAWPDGTLSDYFNSLQRLRDIVLTRHIEVLYTAHGVPLQDPISAIDRQVAHRNHRLERVRNAAASGAGRDITKILEQVYDDVDKRLNPGVRMNIQAQLSYLEEHELPPGTPDV